MTRKDYVAIAAAIKEAMQTEAYQDAVLAAPSGAKYFAFHIAQNIARAMGSDNPRFDRARFLTACGIN